jgi:hypothetical protein
MSILHFAFTQLWVSPQFENILSNMTEVSQQMQHAQKLVADKTAMEERVKQLLTELEGAISNPSPFHKSSRELFIKKILGHHNFLFCFCGVSVTIGTKVGVDGPLVDKDGFPRNDVDIPAIRAKRHELACEICERNKKIKKNSRLHKSDNR